ITVHEQKNQCKIPYILSLFNIFEIRYSTMSRTAIKALNKGAALQNFAHNTGEAGISVYHLQRGDLIWQIGTGYFGCRDDLGFFDEDRFQEKAVMERVKMIELKLSQGATPGHAWILPAQTNTSEIAAIRHGLPGTDVLSRPASSAY